jgi:hypothetical protein
VSADRDPLLSAQVVLRDPAEADSASSYFSNAGFETDPVVGTSFAIVGPLSMFERVFGERPEPTAEGGWSASAQEDRLELSLARLPTEVGTAVEAVTFSPPPAFPGGKAASPSA